MCARCRVEINQAIKSAVIRCQSLAKVGGA